MKLHFTALWLALICIAVFILQAIFGTDFFILDNAVKFSEPWRIVTAIFAHGSIGHLLSNLFGLALFGLILEGRIGAKRVLWLFLLSGIIINIFSPYPISLGASGAIYAILGTLTILRQGMIVWVSGMPMPMIVAGFLWLVQDILGVFIPSNVANLAHIGGLFLGVGMGIYWRKQFKDKPKRKHKHNPKLEKELDRWERKYM